VAERRQVTVLFADLAGFTSFVHKSDVEDVRDYMSSLWGRLDDIIAAHGGLTEKHIGDAVMAVFGARQSREEDPVQAVRTALAIQACLSELPGEGSPPLRMRIGIHTGLVVVGPLGASGELTATGDAVNLANRLEQHAPAGGILISNDTYRHVYGLFDVESLPPLSVKGRPEPVETFLVVGAKPRALAAQLRGVEGVQTEMVGRECELQRLQLVLEQVMAARECQVVTIVGEAGLGKTCLLRAFQKWVELIPQTVRFFSGRATPETAGLPFSLMRDVFSARFEIQDSDPPGVARQKLERGWLHLLRESATPELLAPEEEQSQAHFVGQLLGLDFSASASLRDILHDAEQVRQRAFNACSRFFTAVSLGPAQINAGVLVVEDLHWSDDGSLELLVHLARTCARVPLLIVGLARPTLFERRPDWESGLPAHHCVLLEPLSRRESQALAENILHKTPQLPQALRELIVGGAEGNPFYIEEIIKMLIEQKVILPGAEQWRVEPEQLAAARVPPTVTGVLQARLDSLSLKERLVLQRASVIGRVFWDSAVQWLSTPGESAAPVTAEDEAVPAQAVADSLASRPPARSHLEPAPTEPSCTAELCEALASLRRKELIFRRESSAFAGAVEYIFKHELLRNVAYESMLKKLRREYHAQAAHWLIEQNRDRSNEVAGLIATHFEQAARLAEAADWYGRAGAQARTGYASAAAIDYFRKALALLPAKKPGPVSRQPTPSSDLKQSSVAETPAVASETPTPLPAALRKTLLKQLEWQEGLADALGAQARFNEAVETWSAALALADTLAHVVAQARACNGLAFLNERLGRNRVSLECAERAELLARQAGAAGRSERIRALLLKGWAHYRLSDAPAVLALADQTQPLCLESADRPGRATCFKLRGVAHLQLGRFSEADAFFEQGLALYQESGDRRNAAAMWSNLGESARLRGDYLAAETLYQTALDAARQINRRESETIYLSNLSGARLGLGKFVQVEADAREVITLTAGANSCILSETYGFLSEACLGQGKLAESLEAARRSLALAREAENDLNIGSAWRTLGLVTARLSRDAAAPRMGVEADRQGSANTGAQGAVPGVEPQGPANSLPTEDPAHCFAESLRVFEKIDAQGEQARTLRAWGQFELRQGLCAPGRQRGLEARRIFERLSAGPEVARTDALLEQHSPAHSAL
jgi:predicted ATPase/class 3 adenylate cyclase